MVRFHLIEKIIVQNELTELFMDEPLDERSSFLIGQLFWLGFRRREIKYERRARAVGKSAWGLKRRLRYMLDNVFAFSDLPISMLLWLGSIGIIVSTLTATVIVGAWLLGFTHVRGYTPIVTCSDHHGIIALHCSHRY